MSVARKREYKGILNGSEVAPPDSETLDISTEAGKEKLRLRKGNENGYHDLILANRDPVAFNIVDKAVTTDHPDGSARLAWLELERKYDSSRASTVVKLSGQFNNSELKNTIVDPEEWIVYLEILRARLLQK